LSIVVVSDTSPLNYLIQIELSEVLRRIYDRVLIPAAVLQELKHAESPLLVRAWLLEIPAWIEVQDVQPRPDPTLDDLDPGESAAIQLAQDIRADLVLMDEKLGVRRARDRGLKVAGTLGVLVQAAALGFVDIDEAITRLEETSFRCTPELFDQARRAGKK
jgi:predicted nucleic acid-binding protein